MIVKAIASLVSAPLALFFAVVPPPLGPVTPGAAADSHFSMALKRGVDASHFVMPKGASGTAKLAPELKKAAKFAEKKAAAPLKKAVVKKVVAKPAAVKKAAAPKKSSPKKAAAPAAAAPPKAKRGPPKERA
ncbi:hypothetical protein BDK51DRAFT_42993 [Blyttiomyces helicus]|uniref:Histone H1 n=1 Tax=Blyttiomyces helicus TaxID=388810 RepID=A0A4P9WNS2_9FUNG|nr:hypothetical protein BDK51DRAFT_42993 [Blyttiomyces helicus]|eukprot:RKO94142.1 hypothetical protein BDK51DRAFT_42993 [Blyttiomyces helicus]